LQGAAQVSLGLASAIGAGTVWSQPRKSSDSDFLITQIVDVSQAQQDVSKDYLIGARAAWQEINLQGGLQGRKVRHSTLEVDGSPSDLRAALTGVYNRPQALCVFGTAGHPAAQGLSQLLNQEKLPLAHIAPWLQVEPESADLHTFPIFAMRHEQIAFAIKNLSSMNVREIGAVYATEAEYSLYRPEVDRSAKAMQLSVQHLRNGTDLGGKGQRWSMNSPAVMLFLGGTPELAKFTNGLEQQARMRYCVAMADVNLQTLAQMGAGRRTAIIVTQVVPLVNAKIPVVRAYREAMGRLFDEPATPVSLAGYLAARYAFEVLSTMKEPFTRQSVLTAFQRAAPIDLGGFQVNGQRRSNHYVTQSMLATDGRLVG
jgi:ABC-type branched-subunit amino acid transport system substrate-binding protein